MKGPDKWWVLTAFAFGLGGASSYVGAGKALEGDWLGASFRLAWVVLFSYLATWATFKRDDARDGGSR